MQRFDFIVSIALVAFGAFVLQQAWTMPRFENIGGSLATAPGLVPGLLGAILVLFGLVMMIRARLPRTATEDAPVRVDRDASEPAAPVEPAAAGWIRFAWVLGLSLLYATVLVGRVPFWLATFLFVTSSIVVFERSDFTSRRSIVVRSAVAITIGGVVSCAVPFVFERIFLVNLP